MVALLVWAAAATTMFAGDYTTYLTQERGFTEVTTLDDIVGDAGYYYILTSAETTNLIVGIGRYEAKPDWASTETKALRYREVDDPVADLSNFFTVEKDGDYIGFRNVVVNGDLFQTHDNAGYMYVNTYTDKSLDEWSYLTPTFQNGYWLFESGKYPMSSGNWACGYLGPWNNTVAAGEPLALNRRNTAGDEAGHYRLFRITKEALTTLKRTPLYSSTSANPVDATWFIVNPSFETGDETGWALNGKLPNKDDEGNESENVEFRTREYGMSNKAGNYLMNAFQWWSSSLSVSQTVADIPSGEYELSGVVATWENRTVTFSGNENTITTNGQGDGTGIRVTTPVTIGTDGKLVISAGSEGQWWVSGHEDETRTFFKLDDVQLKCKQLYLDGMSKPLPNNEVTVLDANQWYYYDVTLGTEYVLIGPLDGLVYSNDGDKPMTNVSTSAASRQMELAVGRTYFKTTRSDATLYVTPKCAVNEGTFTAVALNVDGLPNTVAGINLNADGPGESGTKKISQYLASKGYDMLGCSEDFNYNGSLMESLKANYTCGTIRRTLSVSGLLGGIPFDTDGLNLLWKNSKVSATNESWTRWNDRTDTDGNQYVKKGYRHYDVKIDGAVMVDVYILHMDAGDTNATGSRESQWRQLADAINSADASRPKLIIGDTNSRWTREDITTNFMNRLNTNLTASDVWVELYRNGIYPTTDMGDLTDQSNPTNYTNYEVVDKIIYINPTAANTVQLVPQSFRIEQDYTYDYVDHDGNTKALGDHRPVVVEFKWMKAGDTVNMPITLTDDADNTKTIANSSDVPADVTLQGRTLYQDNAWNTLCLPFPVNSFEDTPLEGATVKTLESASFSNGTLTLNFSTEALSSIEAGKPYIVKWESGNNISNPLFASVTITNDTPSAIDKDVVTFCGLYAPLNISTEDNTMLYLTDENTLLYPNKAMSIGAFRAYFKLGNGLTAGNPSGIDGVRQFVLNFGDGTQSIFNVERSTSNVQSPEYNTYDLQGRHVQSPTLPKGLYIRGGKKVVIK